MAVIVIGGAGRGAGKTSVACSLLAALNDREWWAAKLSYHAGPTLLTEEHVPSTGPDAKDTQRFLAAGARRAFLLQPDSRELANLIAQAPNLLIESNTVLDHIEPDVALAVFDATQPLDKASLAAALQHFDAYVATSKAILPSEWPIKMCFLAAAPRFASPLLIGWLRQAIHTVGDLL